MASSSSFKKDIEESEEATLDTETARAVRKRLVGTADSLFSSIKDRRLNPAQLANVLDLVTQLEKTAKDNAFDWNTEMEKEEEERLKEEEEANQQGEEGIAKTQATEDPYIDEAQGNEETDIKQEEFDSYVVVVPDDEDNVDNPAGAQDSVTQDTGDHTPPLEEEVTVIIRPPQSQDIRLTQPAFGGAKARPLTRRTIGGSSSSSSGLHPQITSGTENLLLPMDTDVDDADQDNVQGDRKGKHKDTMKGKDTSKGKDIGKGTGKHLGKDTGKGEGGKDIGKAHWPNFPLPQGGGNACPRRCGR